MTRTKVVFQKMHIYHRRDSGEEKEIKQSGQQSGRAKLIIAGIIRKVANSDTRCVLQARNALSFVQLQEIGCRVLFVPGKCFPTELIVPPSFKNSILTQGLTQSLKLASYLRFSCPSPLSNQDYRRAQPMQSLPSTTHLGFQHH